MNTIYRYEVPTNDQVYRHEMTGRVVHVACRNADIVEVWAFTGQHPPIERFFRAYGTGQPMPAPSLYVATAPADFIVWHLYACDRVQKAALAK